MMAPEVFELSTTVPLFDGDEVTVSLSRMEGAVAFLQVSEGRGGGLGAAFLSKDETLAIAIQLINLAQPSSLELLALMFPDPLTRPIYTVGDMSRAQNTEVN